jgi:hypothetical protein
MMDGQQRRINGDTSAVNRWRSDTYPGGLETLAPAEKGVELTVTIRL